MKVGVLVPLSTGRPWPKVMTVAYN